jgi:hypothetical protein
MPLIGALWVYRTMERENSELKSQHTTFTETELCASDNNDISNQ